MITIHWIWIYLIGVILTLMMMGKKLVEIPVRTWAKSTFWKIPFMLAGSWVTFIIVAIYLAWCEI